MFGDSIFSLINYNRLSQYSDWVMDHLAVKEGQEPERWKMEIHKCQWKFLKNLLIIDVGFQNWQTLIKSCSFEGKSKWNVAAKNDLKRNLNLTSQKDWQTGRERDPSKAFRVSHLFMQTRSVRKLEANYVCMSIVLLIQTRLHSFKKTGCDERVKGRVQGGVAMKAGMTRWGWWWRRRVERWNTS